MQFNKTFKTAQAAVPGKLKKYLRNNASFMSKI